MELISRQVRWLVAVAALGALAGTTPSAAAAVVDRGLRLGDGVLHPYYQLEPRYVVNPGRLPDVEVSDLALANRLGIDLEYPSALIELRLGVAGEYAWFPGLQDAATSRLSDWGGTLDLQLDINRAGAVRFTFKEHLNRSSDAYNQSLSQTLRRINNATGLELTWKPGGGALELTFNYLFDLNLFSNPDGGLDISFLDTMGHQVMARAMWRFLPKTAFTLTVKETPTFYLASGPDFTNVNSYPLEASFGMVGLLTARLSTVLSAGYADMFMAGGGASLRTGIAQAELAYRLGPTALLKGGYVRSISPVSFFRYYSRDRLYASYTQQFGEQWQAGQQGAYNYLDFGPPLAASPQRNDQVTELGLRLAYRFQHYFTIELQEAVEYRDTPYVSQAGPRTSYLYNVAFVRFEARY